jgi:hypothetical protein
MGCTTDLGPATTGAAVPAKPDCRGHLGQSGGASSHRRPGLFMPLTLAEQECSNCRFSRRPAGFGADGRLSCRYLPPQPCDNNIWRLVPENFWCGKWEWGPQEPISGKQMVPVREVP